jgi:site-specific DNA recombinase
MLGLSNNGKALRAALYARVSTEEQVEGYSLDAQRRAFRQFCEQKGWHVYREYIEEGRSAHTEDVKKRPVFLQASEDALSHNYDVLVVHKLDRFSRRLRITIEYFEKLGKAGVGFVSILNQVDYSRPEGKFMLVMLGGLAELYSDNLSEETRKGWAERKAQGFYCGPLPFGAIKGEDGVPAPHPDTYPGLVMAFELATQGKSDREVARALDAAGYRTSSNRGPRPFTKDGVRGMLTNRFYIGELPDGDGNWLKGRHQPLIEPRIFDEVQCMRSRNRRQPKTIKLSANTYSLSGLLRCLDCQGPMWIHQNIRGRARIYCREQARGSGCTNRGTFLDVYEAQIGGYLQRFVIPEDYQTRIVKLYNHLEGMQEGVEQRRKELERRLERIKKLYEWGDKSEQEYLSERRQINEELTQLTPEEQRPDVITRFQRFLADVPSAWGDANQEQRNRLARLLFEVIWVKNEHVVAVRPHPEFRVFFQISEECQMGSMSGDPERIRTADLCLDRAVC